MNMGTLGWLQQQRPLSLSPTATVTPVQKYRFCFTPAHYAKYFCTVPNLHFYLAFQGSISVCQLLNHYVSCFGF